MPRVFFETDFPRRIHMTPTLPRLPRIQDASPRCSFRSKRLETGWIRRGWLASFCNGPKGLLCYFNTSPHLTKQTRIFCLLFGHHLSSVQNQAGEPCVKSKGIPKLVNFRFPLKTNQTFSCPPPTRPKNKETSPCLTQNGSLKTRARPLRTRPQPRGCWDSATESTSSRSFTSAPSLPGRRRVSRWCLFLGGKPKGGRPKGRPHFGPSSDSRTHSRSSSGW